MIENGADKALFSFIIASQRERLEGERRRLHQQMERREQG